MMIVAYFSHRVENLPLLRKCVENCDVFILEEPRTPELEKLLEGKLDPEEYVKWVDTAFPVYTKHYAKFLLNLKSKGVKILAVEPYLQIIEGIHESVELGSYEEYVKKEEVKAVIEVERRATQALLDYQETFMKKDFDKIVEATLKFSKEDAVRFRMRDYLRAKEIKELLESDLENLKVVIEAGQIHTYLVECLRRMGIVVKTENLVLKASREIGVEYIKNPGMILTEIHINQIKVKKDYEKLLSAQALVYISLVKKDEMLPDEVNKYPHLIDEVKCAKIARSLDYQQCKKFFEKIWIS